MARHGALFSSLCDVRQYSTAWQAVSGLIQVNMRDDALLPLADGAANRVKIGGVSY